MASRKKTVQVMTKGLKNRKKVTIMPNVRRVNKTLDVSTEEYRNQISSERALSEKDTSRREKTTYECRNGHRTTASIHQSSQSMKSHGETKPIEPIELLEEMDYETSAKMIEGNNEDVEKIVTSGESNNEDQPVEQEEQQQSQHGEYSENYDIEENYDISYDGVKDVDVDFDESYDAEYSSANKDEGESNQSVVATALDSVMTFANATLTSVGEFVVENACHANKRP